MNLHCFIDMSDVSMKVEAKPETTHYAIYCDLTSESVF